MEERTVQSQLPVTWKALQPKDSNEVYYLGNKKKNNKRKVRSNPLDLMVNKQDQMMEQILEQNTWSHNQVKEIFPQLKNQQNHEDKDIYEDMKILSLEDLKVYTKRVIKEKSAEEKLWNAADFPSIVVGAGVDRVGNKIKAEYADRITKSSSTNVKKHEKGKESNGCITFGSGKVFTSSSSQTDHLFFTKSYQDANFKYLCTNLPPDLNKLFHNYIFERDELRRLLVHLLELLCGSDGNLPQVSSVPLKTALSSSEKALILSEIF